MIGSRRLQPVLIQVGKPVPPYMDLKNFISQVRFNCQIANASQAGNFSLCGLLLRLRQLYKWEHGLAPWQEPDSAPVLAWIEAQEGLWDSLEEEPWRRLPWNSAELDPYSVESINEALAPQGLAYGAGLSRGLAPTFFLGELAEVRHEGDITILVLGAELARDLDGTPALRQGSLAYARKQALAFYLWDRLADPGQQKNPFLNIALAAQRMRLADLLQDPGAHQEQFSNFLAGELEAVIRHELGEAMETSLGDAFAAIVSRYPQTRLELWIRGLKDALAEVNEWGRLAYLIKARHLPSLAVMLAWRPGLYPMLLPELEPAFRELLANRDWQPMEQARAAALARLRRTAQDLRKLLDSQLSPEETRQTIESRFLAPLGL